ncbi:MAG: thioredoxin family protein [Actinobacteria bacterium]|nr:thioredoxin family protein [Actinomycetota bacterium]
MTLRLLIVAALLAAFVAFRIAYDRRRRRIASDDRPVPRLPGHLVDGAEATWVVFTTPYCASCGPVVDRLQGHGPVITVDATRDPDLAEAFRIRSAPTVLLADAAGAVHGRFVGAAAVDAYLQTGSSASERRGLARSRAERIG